MCVPVCIFSPAEAINNHLCASVYINMCLDLKTCIYICSSIPWCHLKLFCYFVCTYVSIVVMINVCAYLDVWTCVYIGKYIFFGIGIVCLSMFLYMCLCFCVYLCVCFCVFVALFLSLFLLLFELVCVCMCVSVCVFC